MSEQYFSHNQIFNTCIIAEENGKAPIIRVLKQFIIEVCLKLHFRGEKKNSQQSI